jgi:hypothetical protein
MEAFDLLERSSQTTPSTDLSVARLSHTAFRRTSGPEDTFVLILLAKKGAESSVELLQAGQFQSDIPQKHRTVQQVTPPQTRRLMHEPVEPL